MGRYQETRLESIARFFETARYAFVRAHRGVSAPSFRDGAIRWERQLLSWQVFCGVVKRTKSGSRDFVSFRSQPAGYPAITHTSIVA